MAKRITPKQVKRMGELRAQGMSYRAIGREVGHSHQAVRRWLVPAAREYQREYRARPERRAKERERRASPEYKAKEREYMREYMREYQAKPERKAKERERKANPEYKAWRREYQARRLANDVQYKLSVRLRDRLRDAIRDSYKSGSAVRNLGCSIAKLKAHLEAQFEPGMTWDNWSFEGWHIDHIIPLAAFDLTDREQLKKACHYTNLQPMWAEENLSKGAKILEEVGLTV